VKAAGDDPRTQDGRVDRELIRRRAVAQDLVSPFALVETRRADIEELIPRKVRVERQAEEAGFAHRANP